MDVRAEVRSYVGERLKQKGYTESIADATPLFSTGQLDSFDAIETIMFLEEEYGITFSDLDFDLTLLDSIDAIADLVVERRK
jgi:acyl carrier protein